MAQTHKPSRPRDQDHDPDRDRPLVVALVRWFRANARDLPWRERPLGRPRAPYPVLVSELMLQQTQASRVTERFDSFLARFPSVEALARADEAAVLAEWSGLGYYRRARLLQAAARAITEDHAGRFPPTAAALAALPGVGRYTAGAIASACFHERTPAVDANVLRVILRLEGRPLAAADPEAARLCWSRAGALHAAAPRSTPTPSLLNEALIELGAVVCTPRSPRCQACPIADHCRARAQGTQGSIPAKKAPTERKALFFASVLVRDARGRLAVTRRPDSGLWAGLYQAPTLERPDRPATPAEIRRAFGLPEGRAAFRRLPAFDFQTTHRRCRFEVFEAAKPQSPPSDWRFLPKVAIADLALSSPQRRILLESAPR